MGNFCGKLRPLLVSHGSLCFCLRLLRGGYGLQNKIKLRIDLFIYLSVYYLVNEILLLFEHNVT